MPPRRQQEKAPAPPPPVLVAAGDVSHGTPTGAVVDLHAGDTVPPDLFTVGELDALLRCGAVREAAA